MASATSVTITTMTMPGSLKETAGPWIIVQLPKCVLALTRRQFLAGLAAGKRWRRQQSWQARHPEEPR